MCELVENDQCRVVEEYGIVAGHVLAILGNANSGINKVKFISLATVQYILPFVRAELGRHEENVHLKEASYL